MTILDAFLITNSWTKEKPSTTGFREKREAVRKWIESEMGEKLMSAETESVPERFEYS